LKPPFEHGVLVNMRHILVYEKNGLEVDRVSLLDLYRTYRDQPKAVLDHSNTKAFLEFVSQFRRKDLTREKKIEILLTDKDISLLPKPDPEELVAAIHRIVNLLAADARRFKTELERVLKSQYNVDDREPVLHELDEIARELDRHYVPAKDDRVGRFLNARTGSVEARAFDVFVTRVAYFTMTRFLVARMWEDVGFLEQRLYDGGFRHWYETLGRRIKEVLAQAFHYARDRYGWLYGDKHNYFWYDPPSEEAIVDVLYELARFNLGLLDTDVLGTVYEQFVERVDRKNKGQYYTPREVIKFIWDRVGYNGEDGCYRFEDGGRHPRLVLDVATGSGGFLVEAANRLRTLTRYSRTDPNEMLEVLHCMMNGLWGCEISQFANYITEVNLLIQLTPLVRAIIDASKGVPRDLRTVRLMTAPGDSLALVGAGPLFAPGNNHFVRDSNRELIARDPKGPVRELMTNHFDYDYVCSNPPYVGEKGHKELFRSTREAMPYWNRHYKGKMDYLYWFVILGLLKLREGGKLGFITPSSWPTADGASHLREFILENALVHEIIDFGETRIFKSAPGQFNMVFVLEKCPSMAPNASALDGIPNPANVERKAKHRIKIVKVKAVPPARPGDKRPPLARVIDHISGIITKTHHSDDYADMYQSAQTQGELDAGPWGLFVDRASSAVLDRIEAGGSRLGDFWTVDQGVVPSPLRLTRSKLEKLPADAIRRHGLKEGDGVFVLKQSEVEALRLDHHDAKLVKPYYKNSDIDSYVTSSATDDHLVYASGNISIDDYPGVKRHLDRFRVLLEARLSDYGESYQWFELHRARDSNLFEGPKVVCSYRVEGTAFAYNDASFYGSTDMYFIKPRDAGRDRHSLKYLAGVLNSKLMDFWLRSRGKPKGTATELFSTPVENIRIHRINFEDKHEVAEHDRLVKLVDEMIETKQALTKLNRFFGARLTRLAGPDELPEVGAEVVTLSLPESAKRRVRNHPKVTVEPEPDADFVLSGIGEVGDAADLFSGRSDEEMRALRLTGKGRKAANVIAPKEILRYLQEVLPKFKGKTWPEVKEIPIARDLATYQAKEKKVLADARALLRKVAATQSKIDALVYELYGLSESEIATIEGPE
jgi:hypothetical protein